MAKQKNNVVTHGLSGKIGDLLIFRQVNGQTVVSKIPEKSKTVSEKQLAQRKRFQQAIIYAKSAAASPETDELYKNAARKQKGKNPVSIAVADFFNAPDIEHVDMSGYGGSAGDIIRMQITDDFMVESVKVIISNAAGIAVEEGEAVHGGGSLWIYTATEDNGSPNGSRVEIRAYDLPGNETENELKIEN